MFIGREGLPVAIVCLGSDAELIGAGGVRTRTATRVVVGMTRGQWREDGRLGWELDGSKRSLVRGVGVDPKPFLHALRVAVCQSAQEKAPQLVPCAQCQELVGPELRHGDICVTCATSSPAPVLHLVGA